MNKEAKAMQWKYRGVYLGLISFLMTTSSLTAHPGHGSSDGFSFWHFMTEPQHLIPSLVVLLLIPVLLVLRSRKEEQKEK